MKVNMFFVKNSALCPQCNPPNKKKELRRKDWHGLS